MTRRGILVGALGALALHAAGGPASATFTQEPGSPYAVGADPYGALAADFNADNRIDVAAMNGTASTVSVLLRQPGGGFAHEALSPYSIASGPNYGALADFNADNRPDIAVASYNGTANVSVLLRQPGGSFAHEAGSPFLAGGWGSDVVVADFNGDTRPDLAALNYDFATVTVAIRGAGGGFTLEAGPASTGPNPRRAAVADFNADGRTDLAVANAGGGSVSILLRNIANTGFAAEAGSPVTVGTTPQGIASDDFNGDGRPDFAVANSGSHTVSVFLRQAAGGFAAEGAPISVGLTPVGVATSDFNGDGMRDLAVTNEGAGNVSILLRQSGGGFSPDPSSPVTTANGAHGIAVADFNADSRPDIVVVNLGAANMTILLNSTPSPASTLPPAAPPPAAPPAAPPPAGTTPTKKGTTRIRVAVSNTFRVRRGRGTRIVTLTARGVPRGARVEVRCRGRSCPFKKPKRVARRSATVRLARVFRDRWLTSGTRIEIRVTKPSAIGSVTRFAIRKFPKLPKKSSLCLRPGAKTPSRRC
jgi:hypothetical protein